MDATASRAVLDRYCVACHNDKAKASGLTLEGAAPVRTGDNPEVWEKVVRKLRTRAMPPTGRPRPDAAMYESLTAWLESSLDHAAAAHPNPGRTEGFHRLNRAEYQNAVRDLLGIDIDVAQLLPADDADGHGFDNIADVLSVSPALLARYLAAARTIARLAVGHAPNAPAIQTYKLPLLLMQDDRAGEELPFGSRGGLAVRYYFPVDGEYSVKVRLQTNYVNYIRGLRRPHQLDVRLDGERIKRFTVGGEAKGKTSPSSFAGNIFGDPAWEQYMHEADAGLEVRFPAKAGTRVVSVSFLREVSEPEGVLQPRQNENSARFNEMWDGNPAVDTVDIGGPFTVDGPGDTINRRKIFVCRPHRGSDEEPCARQILTSLAGRGYRRTVGDADVQPLVDIYKVGRAGGDFENGIQLAIARMLAGPDFLFRVELDPANVASGAAYRISDVELASRLSFFLTSSIPDDELLELAGRGKLHEPRILEQQVRRLLANPRSTKALVDNFAGQWLSLRNLRDVAPDLTVFVDFDENLRDAFKRETELFVESQLREDHSVMELLTANYTFVNERLAQHYGIPGVYGSDFRRVTLEGDQRGGLLSQGSVLAVTSYPSRTSPVLRGKWVLENLLGAAPPPPPPNIPPLKENEEGSAKRLSVRERVEQHRKNPACSVCHARMDPLGFALENFDAIGKWRDIGEDGGPIDASGVFPNGREFRGLEGVRDLVLSEPESFVETVTEKLLMYALGRAPEYYDQPAIRKIAKEAAVGNYRWSAIVLGIVKSTPFQMRRSAS